MSDLRIASWHRSHNGHWLVIRMTDRKIVFSDESIKECLAWVVTWGDELGLSKRGVPLSSRCKFPEELQ